MTADTYLPVGVAVFREVMAREAEDGLVFDAERLRADAIREDVDYGGVRLRTTAMLEKARSSVTIDIGFGDAIEPGAVPIDDPVLLDMRAHGFAPLHGRPSSPRSSRPWWRSAAPTAA